MKKGCFLTIFIGLLAVTGTLCAQPQTKIAEASRTTIAPKIDGSLDDLCWSQAMATSSLVQFDPNHGKPESQTTMVYFAYDDDALYVGAFLFEKYPDSILTQLGARDDNSLNADWFSVHFDTYNNRMDAYTFRVSASGVQSDYMRSDGTYDAVWQSAVNISAVGWVVEMKIPYSALRFPMNEQQIWGLQVERYIRRNRELSQWALTPKGVANYQNSWGELVGLASIKPPLRLALKPYLSGSLQHDESVADPDARMSYSYGGGADIKYGINQSYTLDMMLYPDFSQVKSDDKVKNLSAFETVYAEQRPFFNESVDLFKKGGLFYSRRIGGQPAEFGNVSASLEPEEIILSNPVQSRMLSATKVSGRGSNGLAVGFLNAVTGNTWAEIENAKGGERRMLTDPFTNFNITVLDQVLRNNSSAYLINTSVIRSNQYGDANVTGAGTTLNNKQGKYRLNASGALSQVFDYDQETGKSDATRGYKYWLSAGKVSGRFQFNLYRNVFDDQYNDNDLGITHRNDFVQNGAQFSYFLFEPVGKVRSLRGFVSMSRETSFTTAENINTLFQSGYSMTGMKYISNWLTLTLSPFERYDYYDPREKGRFYIRPGYFSTSWGFSTDYRKPLAFDGSIWFSGDQDDNRAFSARIQPRFRFSDRLSFYYALSGSLNDNNPGWVEKDGSGSIIYGKRDLTSWENTLSGQYMFRSNLSMGLWLRQYWYYGVYNDYFTLLENGRLSPILSYNKDNDFNFNTFNVDLSVNWDFAPGSRFSFIWKNSIATEDETVIYNFMDNLKNTLNADQLNQFSLKLLYYIDYQTVFKSKG